MTPHLIVQFTGACMDVLALTTLVNTSEIHPLTTRALPFLALSALLFNRYLNSNSQSKIKEFLNRMLNRAFFISLGIILIGFGLFLWLKLHFILIVSVATTVPLLHSLLWFVPENPTLARTAQLRLALCFMELLIGAILTTDFFLTLGLFAFTLLASINLSCSYLKQAFEDHPSASDRLSVRYLSHIVSIAFLVLLSAGILFPLLPRSHFGQGSQDFRPSGFSEQVNLDNYSRLLGSDGGKVVLRVAYADQSFAHQEVATEALLGLFRAKTFEGFDGRSWIPTFTRKEMETQVQNTDQKTSLVIDREPMESFVLPTPYGTEKIVLLGMSTPRGKPIDFKYAPTHLRSGEWSYPVGRGNKISYRVEIGHNRNSKYGSGPLDLPSNAHFLVPKALQDESMTQLATEIFGKSVQQRQQNLLLTREKVEQKVRRLIGFYERKKMQVASNRRLNSTSENSSPIKDFLLYTHEGNCELFASSAAILLRLAGIPTRLVNGFRVTRGTHFSNLTLRSSDAHAWIEYWVEGVGWKIYDPTPRSIRYFSFLDQFKDQLQDAYDQMESFWFRHVYSYDAEAQIEATQNSVQKIREIKTWNPIDAQTQKIGFILLPSLFIFFYFFYKMMEIVSFLFRRNEGPWPLRVSRLSMERLLRRSFKAKKLPLPVRLEVFRMEKLILKVFGEKALQAYLRWRDHYLTARFGMIKNNLDGVLRSDYTALKKILSRET